MHFINNANTQRRFAASCREQQAGSLCSPETVAATEAEQIFVALE